MHVPSVTASMAKPRTQRGYEYRLLVRLRFDEREQVTKTQISLQTMASFASFRYELSVQETRFDNGVKLKILGLKAPQLSLPSSGPASFMREYTDMTGAAEIIVEGLDDSQSTFSVNITRERVTLVKKPKDTRIEIIVDDHRSSLSDQQP